MNDINNIYISTNDKAKIMNSKVKMILLVVGVLLLGYGIYTLITPEASMDLGVIKAEVQDNNDSYITIALGLVAIVLSRVGGKKA
jgi:nitric oxide reductase large subunit